MGDFTYLVFTVVATVAATMVAVFATGVVAVLLQSPGGPDHTMVAPAAAEPTLHRHAA